MIRFVVAFVSRKSKKTGPTERRALFGPPLLLQGEDPAAYDELLARVNAAVQPVNIIEEILINDFVFLEWEVLRGRRLKWSVMQAIGRKALQEFLVKQLESNYALHEEHFKYYLAEIFRNNLPEDQVDSAERLAAECLRLSRKHADEIQSHMPSCELEGPRHVDGSAGEVCDLDAARATQVRNDSFSRGQTTMDRYERRALSRRKFAIRAFDAAKQSGQRAE